MTEPGGFIHWEELDVVNMYIQGDNAAETYPYCTKYIEYGQAWLKARGIQARYVRLRKLTSESNIDLEASINDVAGLGNWIQYSRSMMLKSSKVLGFLSMVVWRSLGL